MTEYQGDNIAYTKGDSFYMEVTCDDGFADSDILEFCIAPSEKAGNVIFKEIPVSDGKFIITLSDDEISGLSINDYVYKLSLVSVIGGRVTHKSGQFTVKWGE